jgi:hypothetical protein
MIVHILLVCQHCVEWDSGSNASRLFLSATDPTSPFGTVAVQHCLEFSAGLLYAASMQSSALAAHRLDHYQGRLGFSGAFLPFFFQSGSCSPRAQLAMPPTSLLGRLGSPSSVSNISFRSCGSDIRCHKRSGQCRTLLYDDSSGPWPQLIFVFLCHGRGSCKPKYAQRFAANCQSSAAAAHVMRLPPRSYRVGVLQVALLGGDAADGRQPRPHRIHGAAHDALLFHAQLRPIT